MTTKRSTKPLSVEDIEHEALKALNCAHNKACEKKRITEYALEEQDTKWALSILSTLPGEVENAAKEFRTQAKLIDLSNCPEMFEFTQGAKDSLHLVPKRGLEKLVGFGAQMKNFKIKIDHDVFHLGRADESVSVIVYVRWELPPFSK